MIKFLNGLRGEGEYCGQCCAFNAEWACNLTLLLNADDYRNQYSDKIRKPSGKSVFLYMLGNECDFDIQKVDGWAEIKALELFHRIMQAADEKKLKRGIMSNKNLLPADDIKGTFSFDELYDNLENCLACIIEKLKKGNICTFVGAGFSNNANKSYPDWPTLLIDDY